MTPTEIPKYYWYYVTNGDWSAYVYMDKRGADEYRQDGYSVIPCYAPWEGGRSALRQED